MKIKCRYGIDCRNQPKCEYDHTPSDERKSTLLISELMKQIAHELNVSIIKHLLFLLKNCLCI